MLFKDRWIRLTSLVLILALFIVGSLSLLASPAMSQVVPAKVSDFKVTTQDGREVTGQPLIVDVVYNTSFTIEVAAGVKDKAILHTGLERQGDHYWRLKGDYPGIDTGTWQPGKQSITFNLAEGTANIVLTGYVDAEYTTTVLKNEGTLHKADSIALLDLSLESGQSLEKRVYEVTDASIETWRSTLDAKVQLANETEAEPAYTDLVRAVIDKAKAEAEAGYTERAVGLLETIPDSDWSTPQGSNMVLLIVIVVLGVIALLALVLVFRGRSELGFLRQRADDEAKKLDIIEVRVTKIGEKSLAGEITQIKKALESMSGR